MRAGGGEGELEETKFILERCMHLREGSLGGRHPVGEITHTAMTLEETWRWL